MDEMLTPVSAEPELQEEKKELSKPFSLRLGEESVHTFRLWCDEQGMNQADGFAYMVKQLELQQAKDLIPNRQKEVENFQSLLTALTDAFMHSLELNENAETRIRQTLQLQLETKDQALADYQDSVRKKDEKIKELKEKADLVDALQDEVNDLKKNVENYEKQVADKDSIVVMLTEKLSVAEEKAKEGEENSKQYNKLLEEVASATATIERLVKELAHEKAYAEERCKAAKSEAVQQAKEKFQQEKDALQREILDAEKAAHKKEQELQNAIIDLERQLGDLKLDKEKLQNESATKIEKLSRTYNELQIEFNSYKKSHPSAQKPE